MNAIIKAHYRSIGAMGGAERDLWLRPLPQETTLEKDGRNRRTKLRREKQKNRETSKLWFRMHPGKKSEYAKRYYQKHKEKIKAKVKKWYIDNTERCKRSSKDRYLKKQYGISLEIFHSTLEQQKGKCAICEQPLVVQHLTHADHCHTTGKFRALLCTPCNMGLGVVEKDFGTWLPKALAYLKRFNDINS